MSQGKETRKSLLCPILKGFTDYDAMWMEFWWEYLPVLKDDPLLNIRFIKYTTVKKNPTTYNYR